VPAGSGAKAAVELVAGEAEAFALDLQAHKEGRPEIAALTYWSAESMLPSCMAIKDEIAEIRPFLSGQEMRSRRL
jgi:hypothetical protein